MSKTELSRTPEVAHFGHLFPGSYTFGHDPNLMTGEGWNIDRHCKSRDLPFVFNFPTDACT